ncbi:hypothetical protein [Sulfurovum sp.]|uniref:hypothetical protein n=1 Tax=Sulfurovum sp. TaxID=1969726 RepID=UPI002A36C93F|nr:hypothetical protein [Sulfurovum sp.]MDY0403095.1 hypothetical protein [Sulfurovum sp.]
MRKSIYGVLTLHTLFLLGCGGGSTGNTTTVDIAGLIENKDFYRVITEEGRYYRENFDGNGTLIKDIYYLSEDSPDGNTTVSYSIESRYLYITESDKSLRCSVEDANTSVIFKCARTDRSASAVLSTYRWLTLEDAKANPE